MPMVGFRASNFVANNRIYSKLPQGRKVQGAVHDTEVKSLSSFLIRLSRLPQLVGGVVVLVKAYGRISFLLSYLCFCHGQRPEP